MGAKNTYNHDESLRKVEKCLEHWEQRKTELKADLKASGYNEDTLRQLRNVKMHITTCKQRIAGEWIADGTENIIIEKQQ